MFITTSTYLTSEIFIKCVILCGVIYILYLKNKNKNKKFSVLSKQWMLTEIFGRSQTESLQQLSKSSAFQRQSVTGALLTPRETPPPWPPQQSKIKIFYFLSVYLKLRVIEWVTRMIEKENASLSNNITSPKNSKQKKPQTTIQLPRE